MYAREQPLFVELGCGKGNFVATHAVRHADINYLAIDLISKVLASACRQVKAAFAEADRPIDNVLLLPYDIERILNFLSEKDQIERIYINFCNPWPKDRHHKKRLTHPKQLERYKVFLKKGGQIHFKTDDDALFADSLSYFHEAGFELFYQTEDLHASDCKDQALTEHEQKFTNLGIKTKFLIAQY